MNLFKLFKPRKLSRSITKNTEALIQKDWKEISQLLAGKSPSQLKQALITADKTLDNALRDLFDGDTMGERLREGESKFPKDVYQSLWDAHKVRNSLVHESGFQPPHFVLTEKVENFREGLRHLGIKV